jgi:hypothetical protein
VFSLFLFFSNEMPQSRDYKKPTTTFFWFVSLFGPTTSSYLSYPPTLQQQNLNKMLLALLIPCV